MLGHVVDPFSAPGHVHWLCLGRGSLETTLQRLRGAKVAANVGPSWELGRVRRRTRLMTRCECIQGHYDPCEPVLGGPLARPYRDYGTEEG